MPGRQSDRQVRFLLSKASPLTERQKQKEKRELHDRTITITKRGGKRKLRKGGRRLRR